MSVDLTCRDCGTSFVFTTGEQDFYTSKGFANGPSRCRACRTASSRGPEYSAGYARGEHQRQEEQLFAAVCAQCGADTPVSARMALSDDPVYCSVCLAARRGSASASTGGWRDSW